MHRNIYIANLVLIIAALACSFISPSTPIATPSVIDQNQTTEESEAVAAQSLSSITPQATQSAKIIFSDDFSSPTSGWTRTNDGGHLLSYSEGTYLTIAPTRERGSLNVGMSPTEFADAVLSVDFQIVSGDSNDTKAVVGWRAQDWKNYYALRVSDNGFVNVSRLENGEFTPIYDWTKATALITDHQVNHLDIVFMQQTSTVYLNNILITSFQDDTFQMGEIALGGVSSTNSSVEVRYDNIVVYNPDEWDVPIP